MKKYKIKVDKRLIRRLKKYWKAAMILQEKFYEELSKLEKMMEKDTKIKEIEFFIIEGEIVGIGNAQRTMRLIHAHELE